MLYNFYRLIHGWINFSPALWRFGLTVFCALGVISSGQAQAPSPMKFGYLDTAYPPELGVAERPTGSKPESKLWWHDGHWWAVLWGDDQDSYHIYRLDEDHVRWQDTGTPVDSRLNASLDVLWTPEKLYIVSHVFHSKGRHTDGNGAKLYRFSYEPQTRRYVLDNGFPVADISRGSAQAVTIDRDTRGTLWISYVEEGRVMVNHSRAGDEGNWGEPLDLSEIPAIGQAARVSLQDISAVISFRGKVGVMWSSKFEKKFFFAVHEDENPDDLAWQVVSPYDLSTDDHIHLASFSDDADGALYAVVKTTQKEQKIMLLKCDEQNDVLNPASWEAYVVHDIASKSGKPSRPILLLDGAHRKIYVFYQIVLPDDRRAIFYKTTSMDSICFESGYGTPFIVGTEDSGISSGDPTSMKQAATDLTGILVLASDSNMRHYVHNFMKEGDRVALPFLHIQPDTVRFGEVEVGEEKTISLQIKNEGQRELIVSGIKPLGHDQSHFVLPPALALPLRVPPGQAQELPLGFLPRDSGDMFLLLTFETNDLSHPSWTVLAVGKGVNAGANQK